MPTETRVPSTPPFSKDAGPLSPDQIVPTLVMAGIAAVGGCLAFYQKVKQGNVRAFNITELVGEIVISAICGVFAYWLCTGLGLNQWVTAACVGITGHMGSRAIFLLEQLGSKWLAKWLGVSPPSDSVQKEAANGPTNSSAT